MPPPFAPSPLAAEPSAGALARYAQRLLAAWTAAAPPSALAPGCVPPTLDELLDWAEANMDLAAPAYEALVADERAGGGGGGSFDDDGGGGDAGPAARLAAAARLVRPSSAAAASAAPAWVETHPVPGFCVKTRDTNAAEGTGKVVVNVCASSAVPAPGGWEGGAPPPAVTEALARTAGGGATADAGDVEALRLPLSCGAPRAHADAKGGGGAPVAVVDVAFGADVVAAARADPAVRALLARTALATAGRKLGEGVALDGRYKLPRRAAYAPPIPPHRVRAKGGAPLVAEVQPRQAVPAAGVGAAQPAAAAAAGGAAAAAGAAAAGAAAAARGPAAPAPPPPPPPPPPPAAAAAAAPPRATLTPVTPPGAPFATALVARVAPLPPGCALPGTVAVAVARGTLRIEFRPATPPPPPPAAAASPLPPPPPVLISLPFEVDARRATAEVVEETAEEEVAAPPPPPSPSPSPSPAASSAAAAAAQPQLPLLRATAVRRPSRALLVTLPLVAYADAARGAALRAAAEGAGGGGGGAAAGDASVWDVLG